MQQTQLVDWLNLYLQVTDKLSIESIQITLFTNQVVFVPKHNQTVTIS